MRRGVLSGRMGRSPGCARCRRFSVRPLSRWRCWKGCSRILPDWRADCWHLERRYPDRWGRRVQADLTLQIQQMVQEVAQELGVDSQLILAEAQSFLREHDRRTR